MTERDPKPTGDYDIDPAEPPENQPDGARADDQGHNRDEVDSDNP